MNETTNLPLDSQKFAEFFDKDSRLLNEHAFRKYIFKGGISSDMRQEAWKFLFQYYGYNSTPRERIIRDLELHIEYIIMKKRWQQIEELCKNIKDEKSYEKLMIPNLNFNIDLSYLKNNTNSSVNIDYIKIQTILKISRKTLNIKKLMSDIKQIEKDIPRTGYLIEIDEDESQKHELDRLSLNLKDMLITFSAFNQDFNDDTNSINTQHSHNTYDLGYTQGMNEIASTFLCVFSNDESTAYWCYSNFMLLNLHETSAITLNTIKIDKNHSLKVNIAYYFSHQGLSLKLKQLSKLLEQIDNELFERLKELNLDNLYFCHEWLLLCFKRSFKKTDGDYINCFERIASHFIELNTASQAIDFKEKFININNLYTFDLFICLALLNEMRTSILNRKLCQFDCDVYDVIRTYYKDLFSNNLNKIFLSAENIFYNYSLVNKTNVNTDDYVMIENDGKQNPFSYLYNFFLK